MVRAVQNSNSFFTARVLAVEYRIEYSSIRLIRDSVSSFHSRLQYKQRFELSNNRLMLEMLLKVVVR